MSYQQLLFDLQDGVALITLNRPEAMNAWTATMAQELTDAMHRCNDDNAIRAVVLTGAGDRAFCAGADLGRGGGTFSGRDRPRAGQAGEADVVSVPDQQARHRGAERPRGRRGHHLSDARRRPHRRRKREDRVCVRAPRRVAGTRVARDVDARRRAVARGGTVAVRQDDQRYRSGRDGAREPRVAAGARCCPPRSKWRATSPRTRRRRRSRLRRSSCGTAWVCPCPK